MHAAVSLSQPRRLLRQVFGIFFITSFFIPIPFKVKCPQSSVPISFGKSEPYPPSIKINPLPWVLCWTLGISQWTLGDIYNWPLSLIRAGWIIFILSVLCGMLHFTYLRIFHIDFQSFLASNFSWRYTHPETSQRLSTEQVFLRTSTWLEYMNDSQTYPIPFNLLPTRRQTLSFVRASLRRFNIALSTNKLPLWCTDGVGSGGCSRGGDAVLGGLGVRENLVVDEERRYKEVCDRLLQRYLHRALGLSYRHIMAVHHHDSGINQRDAFVNKIEQHIDQWRQSGKIPDLSLWGESGFLSPFDCFGLSLIFFM